MTNLPPLSNLAETAAQLAGVAHEAEDHKAERALNKAIWHLSQGLAILPTTGGWLIPSGTRGGIIHRFSDAHGCSCEAGAAGVPCWHAAAVEIIQVAQDRIAEETDWYEQAAEAERLRIEAVERELTPPTYEEACAAINELFA
jgi:hypothetical protein